MNKAQFSPPAETNEVVVETVIPMTASDIAELSQILNPKLGTVTIKNILNPLLLGGLKVIYQDKVIDLSLKNKLQTIHHHLLSYAQK